MYPQFMFSTEIIKKKKKKKKTFHNENMPMQLTEIFEL